MDAITGFVDEYLSTFDPREITKPEGWNRNFFGVPNFHRKVMYTFTDTTHLHTDNTDT